jgi:hypothetical protein
MSKNPLKALFNSDKDVEVNGKWVYPAGEFEGAPAFLVARAGGANKAFDKSQMAGLKPHRQIIQANAKSPSTEALSIIREVTMRSFVDTCLKGWKNVMNDKDETVEYSKENAVALFKQMPDLYDMLLGDAQSLSTFQSDDREADSGN